MVFILLWRFCSCQFRNVQEIQHTKCKWRVLVTFIEPCVNAHIFLTWETYVLRPPLCLVLGQSLICSNHWWKFVRQSCEHSHPDVYQYLKTVFYKTWYPKGWWTIHSEWIKKVLNSVYIHYETCHFIMMKVGWIRTCRTKECSILNQCNNNPFYNWPKECIIDRGLLGPRTRSKAFNLGTCNRIMCFEFHSQNIRVSKKRGLNSTWVAAKILIRTLVSSEGDKRWKAPGARVSLMFMSTP